MKLIALFIVFLTTGIAFAQPFPLPQGQREGSTATSDAHGHTYETFKTPTGSVTYGSGGERFDTLQTPSGGAVTYGPHGEQWESIPGPATPLQKGK